MIPLKVAFLPLTDCAVLVAAKEGGFARKHGIDLHLVRDVSWATIRDQLIYGQVQCAHLLAPLAVAVSLGLGQHPAALAAPFKLNVNGNAVAFSNALVGRLPIDAAERIADPAATARAFRDSLAGLSRAPVIAVVHRFSCHALALRYWLGSAGIDPDRDIAIRVLPPPFMADALKAGEIDGYSAGEPWNSKAVRMGVGELVAFGSRLWESGPEKVLAMREDWAEEHPDLVDPLLRAVDEAAAWCDNPANRAELARMLSGELYLRQPADLIMHALEGRLRVSAKVMVEDTNFILYHRHAANFPWRSQALWIYSQLVRWRYLSASPDAEQAASHVFRSDIYRRALANSPTSLPAASLKVEGALPSAHPVASSRGGLTLAPDRFFDGRTFDPERIGEYLAEQNLSLN